MKFVQLHSTVDNSPFYINMENVEKMEWTPPIEQTTQNTSTVIKTNYEGYTEIRMMNKEVYYCKETTVEILLKIAEAEPHGQTVDDVVRVIRCKDCKHHINGGCWNKEGRHIFVSDMDYCSRGERREADATD